MTPEHKAKVTEFFKMVRCEYLTGSYTIDNIKYLLVYHGVGFVIIKEAGKGNKKEIRINY